MLKTYKELQQEKELKKPSPVNIEKKQKAKEERIKYKLHVPEWEHGYYRTFNLVINNKTINIVNNVCITYDKQIKDELLKQGYFLLEEKKEN